MKFWIKSDPTLKDFVYLFAVRPLEGRELSFYDGCYWGFYRHFLRKLLRGTGLRLPRHGTKDLAPVEITACRPRAAKRRKK